MDKIAIEVKFTDVIHFDCWAKAQSTTTPIPMLKPIEPFVGRYLCRRIRGIG
ncbi:hypothetical protein ACOYR1_10945 [Thalassotalea piscium]